MHWEGRKGQEQPFCALRAHLHAMLARDSKNGSDIPSAIPPVPFMPIFVQIRCFYPPLYRTTVERRLSPYAARIC